MPARKKFRTYKLYVKTHAVTGLKYLGMTRCVDYASYLGSGLYWRRHLAVYGEQHITELVGEYLTFEEFQKQGIYYSLLWNVVTSEAWANLCVEDGRGGSSGWKLTPEQKTRAGKKGGAKGGRITGPRSYREGTHLFAMSHEELLKHASAGGKKAIALQKGLFSPEQLALTAQRARENNPFKGKKHSPETRGVMRLRQLELIWVTKEKSNVRINRAQLLEYEKLGYRRGRFMSWRRNRKKCAVS